MGKHSFLGSFGKAIVLAVLVFFVIYFFIPSVSEEFFGFSWQSSRDAKVMKEAVTEVLENERVPQPAIDEYLRRMDDPQFRHNLSMAAQNGKDAVVDFLSGIGEGIDFASFDASELGDTLAGGFADLGAFTSSQIKSLQRLFAGALEKLE